MKTNQLFRDGFFKDADFDFAVRCVLGGCAFGAAEAGEVLATIDGVRSGDHRHWFDAWSSTAQRVHQFADDQAAAGNRVSAAGAYLRAASYFGVAVDAVSALGDEELLLPAFRRHRSAWDGFVGAVDVPVEPVAIPYGESTLPGFLFRPAGPVRPRPTAVMVNGSDGAISSMWVNGAAGALARGWNALVFDGPGQQSMLFERGVGFRPDWEAVLTPVVDFLLTREEVDPAGLVAVGISQAGFWVPRALTVEKRFAAAVLDPGVVDVAASWEKHLPGSLMSLFRKGDQHAFDRDMALGFKLSAGSERTWRFRARPYGAGGYFDTLAEVNRYALTAQQAAAIETPLLITAPEREQFWPGQSAQLAQWVSGPVQVLPFTGAEGADFHCEPMARTLVDARVFGALTELIERH